MRFFSAVGCEKGGFTLVELLVVLMILALLIAMLVPSLSAAKRQAFLTSCTMQIRGVGVALRQFVGANQNHLPPFAFSDYDGNLPLSGHWGGWSQEGDPDCFGRRGVENVNLYRLVADDYISVAHSICPGADKSLVDGSSSYFPHTSKFSTYCLRMPYSRDVFRASPSLSGWASQGLLGIYTQAGGGEKFHFGANTVTVPLLRADLSYREINPADGEQRAMNFSTGAILSDVFWYQDHQRQADEEPGLTTYGVRAEWCHDSRFNVLFGDGAVESIADDGTVAANSVGPDSDLGDDGTNFASYAITVWRYFEDNR